jgi:hypothetical protein
VFISVQVLYLQVFECDQIRLGVVKNALRLGELVLVPLQRLESRVNLIDVGCVTGLSLTITPS